MIDQLLCLHRTMTSKHGYDVTVQYVFYFLNENSQGILELGVEFTKGGKLENPEKNPRSTVETDYNNSTHMSSKF